MTACQENQGLGEVEKDWTHRYETVSSLVADIKRHLLDEPVTAAAPTFGYQLKKIARRKKYYTGDASIVAGSPIVVALFSLFQASKAKQAEAIT